MPSDQFHRVEKLTGECEQERVVGQDDNPDFAGTWENYGSTTAPVSFYKDQFNRVWLRGTCKDSTGSPPSTIFTLPEGYRPSKELNYSSIDGTGTPSARIKITAAGVVQCSAGNDSLIGLDGISWRV